MFLANKRSGETSLQALERTRLEEGIDPSVPMTYAGTLDPMAEGVLPILVGDECKEKERFLGKSKEYEVSILFGMSTDSDDILGLIERSDLVSVNRNKVEDLLKKEVGKKKQKYHPFSHKRINGVPLFELAKSGQISEEDLPENEIEIYSVDILGWEKIEKNKLKENINERIGKLVGDFRQKEILENWDNFFLNKEFSEFDILKIKVTCSSGTYMRNLVRNLNRELKISSTSLTINRICIVK